MENLQGQIASVKFYKVLFTEELVSKLPSMSMVFPNLLYSEYGITKLLHRFYSLLYREDVGKVTAYVPTLSSCVLKLLVCLIPWALLALTPLLIGPYHELFTCVAKYDKAFKMLHTQTCIWDYFFLHLF